MKGKKNWTIWGLAFLFTAAGVYNSVVIESHSTLDSSHHSLVKRLDVNGMNRPARMVASTPKWKKLAAIAPQKQVAQITKSIEAAPEKVTEDLNLSLIEVINPEKFKEGLAATDFSGILTTNGSQIETLDISLPQGLGISISYSEINGNVFEYENDGQTFSGMLYQVDQNAYMVSFTAGSLAGTRLRFQATSAVEEVMNEDVAQMDIGQFGQEGYETEEIANLDRQLQEQVNAGSFSF